MKNLFKRNMEIILVISWFVLIIIFAFFFTGCESKPAKPDPHRMELDNDSQYYDQNYRVYTLEGCEYVVVGVGKMQWGSHKGNCKNPIHSTK